MFSQLAERLLRRKLANSPTVQESIEELASNHLGKASKIETAVDGVFAHDLRELAEADREQVAAYTAAKVPGLANSRKAKGSQMGGDFIICDDYRKGTGTVPAVILGLVAAAALGVGGFGAWASMQEKAEVPAMQSSTDTITQIELE